MMQKNLDEPVGQVSLEYLIITGFVLLVAGMLFVFSLFYFNESSNLVMAKSAVTEIANNSNWVASLGNNSRISFEINLPPNVQSFNVGNKTVSMIISTSAGDGEVSATTKVNLTPTSIPISQGKKSMNAAFVDGNVVLQIG